MGAGVSPTLPWTQGQKGLLVRPVWVSLQTERLSAEQIKEYKGVFEMFDEEGNGEVKTGELERLMSLLGINPTKSELTSMAKDVDRDSELVAGVGWVASGSGPGSGLGAYGGRGRAHGECCAPCPLRPSCAPCRQRVLQLRWFPGTNGSLP